MRALRILFVALAVAVALGAAALQLAGRGVFGERDSVLRHAEGPARSRARVEQSIRRQREAARRVAAAAPDRQILFGDLHVHTTISFDAFMLNLPLMGGEGAHPPADACDFARHCAALDFYSLNDHAANIDPEDWRNSIESVRQCNALAGEAPAPSGSHDGHGGDGASTSPEGGIPSPEGDTRSPDMVAFLGWEWTQAGLTPEDHFGHKNVVLAHLDDARIPTRPIAASPGGTAQLAPSVWARGALALQGGRFHDLALRWTTLSAMDVCPDAPVRELPDDCREVAPTPARLFAKLDDWGYESIVIPHGTTWGIYTPPASSWDHQLVGAMHDPERQTLIEVYSGHGDSEVYRDWRAVRRTRDGPLECPEARPDYLPMCRRAGQIVRARCLDAGLGEQECEARAEQARRHALEAGAQPHATVPGASAGDWLDAGQCRDCRQPAFKYRPMGSAQYITALGGFASGSDAPRRFRMGFIASSDIHNARAGGGYKELRHMSDAGGAPSAQEGGLVAAFFRGDPEAPAPRSRSIEDARAVLSGLQLFETERPVSYLYTGGLVAVHAEARDRSSIWRALQRREVYGTSGPRILLWFDRVDADGRHHPMGSETRTRETPRFEVRAVGSFEQAPGCPTDALDALSPARLEKLCRGECHHPTDTRRPITRIEVVRIRPQLHAEEDVAALIDDPWLSLPCPGDPDGCRVAFEDPDFAAGGRDTVYYVRAFEAPIPTFNAGTLRCETDDQGRCLESHPCPRGELCLAPDEPRAWSSPIFVDHGPPADGTG